MNVLSTIAIILILAAGFTKLLDIFLKDDAKENIKQKIENYYITIDDKNPVIIIQAPLIFLSAFYNILFGTRSFSKTAISRSLILSMALLVVSLSVTGVFTGAPFGMKKLPWEYFDEMIKTEKFLYDTRMDDSGIKDEKTKLLSIEYSEKRWKFVSNFNTTAWRVLYSALFVAFVLIINGIIDTISFSFSRMMLNEMIQTRSLILIFSVFFINAFFSVVIATLVLFISMLITMPSMVGIVFRLVLTLMVNEPAWTSIGLFAAAIGAWNLSGGWFKVLALTTIIPTLIFCIIILNSILLNPIKGKLHNFLKIVMLKSIEHDKGIFAFLTIFFTSTGAIIGGVVKLFSS